MTENFPLAKALSGRLGPQIEQIELGRDTEIMQQVTPITAELLRYWFHPDYCALRPMNFHEGQRLAIYSIIYAHEVLQCEKLQDLYEELAPQSTLELIGELGKSKNQHPKYCAKMATGTGKTWVLNALLIWQYLNACEYPEDERFTQNFLIVAPGLIVYDRLLDSFQGKLEGGSRNFESSDIYGCRDLFVPQTYRDRVFSFLQNKVCAKEEIGKLKNGFIAVTNWHLLAGEEDENFVPETVENAALDLDEIEIAKRALPLRPGKATGNSLEVLDRRYLRGGPLEFLKELPALMVFNDEAHHIHDFKSEGEESEVEWQKSLNEISARKGRRFVQIDFSATPYNQIGSGRKKRKKYFSHIVIDFDLNAAMRHGLVKALALDKRREIASLENDQLDFNAERDERKRVIGLSEGQRIMLRAGLSRLRILEEQFQEIENARHPKMMVVCEDTKVTPFVVEFLHECGLDEDDILRVDSDSKGAMKKGEWDETRERLFSVDKRQKPRVIVSVLMLREGFDVNNICVIVPLRASAASILLEQTIGRGLRLMWRHDESIQELKQETRERIANGLEPRNFFDLLFVVEHPRFSEFYSELIAGGLAGNVADDEGKTRAVGDIQKVLLREGYEEFDFAVPYILREAEEELVQPSLDPLELAPFTKLDLDFLQKQIGKGDVFVAEDVQTKTTYGDYRVPGGEFHAEGYNEYLGRVTRRISEALNRPLNKRARSYHNISGNFPFIQVQNPLIAHWVDSYINERLFEREYNPLENENWRVLLLPDITQHIVSVFAVALIELEKNQPVASAEVYYQRLSQVDSIRVRENNYVEVHKCIYPKLPYPARAGGLEKSFMEWADRDATVEAFCKVHEYDHPFMQLNYLKNDGMPGRYSPDFLVRTAEQVYLVETKSQSGLSDINVKRKSLAALAWTDRINALSAPQRDSRQWHYAIVGEGAVREWQARGGSIKELLEYAAVYSKSDEQQQLFK